MIEADKQPLLAGGEVGQGSLRENTFQEEEEEEVSLFQQWLQSSSHVLMRFLGAMYALVGGTMPRCTSWLEKRAAGGVARKLFFRLLLFLVDCLRGASQVYLQNNPLSGLIIVVALFVSDPWLGVCVLVGLLFSTLSAYACGLAQGSIRAGLFGFNGALVGAGLSVFLCSQWSGLAVLAVATGSVFATLVTEALANMLSLWKVPGLTLPFNIVTLVTLLIAYNSKFFPLAGVPAGDTLAALPVVTVEPAITISSSVIAGFFRGFAQVYLADSVASGAMILFALFLCSPLAALFGAMGSATSIAVAYALGTDVFAITQGLVGFNGILGALAIALFYLPSWKMFFMSFLCTCLCTFLFFACQSVMVVFGLPAFTLPFCFGTLFFLLLQDSLPHFTPVPPSILSTPEDHLCHQLQFSSYDVLD